MKSQMFWFIAMWIVFCGLIIYLTELSRKQEFYKLNCELLLGGWHPDVPKKFIELCEEAKRTMRSDR